MAGYTNYTPQNYQYPILAPQYAAQVQQAQPAVQQAPQQNTQIPMQTNGTITWCQGVAGAQAYPVMPGQSAMLLDSEPNAHSFYIKSVDVSGMPMPLRIFDYKERKTEQTESENIKDEIQETINYDDAIRAIEERIDEIAEIQEHIIQRIKENNEDEEKRAREELRVEKVDTRKRERKYEF